MLTVEYTKKQKFELAKNPKISKEILLELLQDKEFIVRKTVFNRLMKNNHE